MEPKIIRYFLISLGLFIVAASSFAFSRTPGQKYVVRVAILSDVNNFDLSIRGKYEIIDPMTNGWIDHGKRLARCTVTVQKSGIAIGEHEYGVRSLRITTPKDTAIYQGEKKRQYRDQIDILLTKENKLLVINMLDLESYVKGVLYHEVPHRWPMNALKAQAVATRTYALYQTKERKGQLYDVVSSVYSQVYGGRSAERHRTNLAVDRTRFEVLMYNGKVLPAYFHSNCGGHTEDAAELWKHDLPPLKGVSCGFCEGLPSYRWKKNFRSKDVQDLLNKNGYSVGSIKEISVIDRTNSGRVRKLKIIGRDGKSATITGTKFRQILGSDTVKSNLFDVEMKGYYFDVIGHGWGHGVGMCQWGAYQMAKNRYQYASILEHYYPGAKIVKISEL
ncbi:MAG: SpoIID/LytB domain-containing protein [Candidatus Omnitrophica bacterium]|nr:SpoIID/LytB domain-containing protein [Candidatus Omnitrophota bacterium]